MIFRNHWKSISALMIPLIILCMPNLFVLVGAEPSWSLIWLLPWSLIKGPFFGGLAGIFLGLLVDSVTIEKIAILPPLLILGYLWGRLGENKDLRIGFIELGLLAWSGSIFKNFLILVQFYFHISSLQSENLYFWALKNLLADAFLTGLIAPIACFYLKKIFMGRKSRIKLTSENQNQL